MGVASYVRILCAAHNHNQPICSCAKEMVGEQGSVDYENGTGAKRVATVWAPAQAGQPLTDLETAREAIAQFQALILEGGVLTVEEISSRVIGGETALHGRCS
ncbi:hypothetical protein L7F22_036568 [Adiantum nelumboides]|nr:hypothetical protein [Adiantum nelumboides]